MSISMVQPAGKRNCRAWISSVQYLSIPAIRTVFDLSEINSRALYILAMPEPITAMFMKATGLMRPGSLSVPRLLLLIFFSGIIYFMPFQPMEILPVFPVHKMFTSIIIYGMVQPVLQLHHVLVRYHAACIYPITFLYTAMLLPTIH